MTTDETNDNETSGERLWLSAARGPMGSHYALSLLGRTESQRVGTIYQLAGGGWHWRVDLTTRDGERRTECGDADSAEEASEQQFDALARIEPKRFARIAA